MSGTGRLDPKSGLFSQKLLETLLSHEVIRSRRYPSPVALMYFALRYPKDASAQVVESAQLVFTNLLQSKIREADLPGIYEGNYLLIMPATDAAGARVAAERLLADFRGAQVTRDAEPFEYVDQHRGEFSCGRRRNLRIAIALRRFDGLVGSPETRPEKPGGLRRY